MKCSTTCFKPSSSRQSMLLKSTPRLRKVMVLKQLVRLFETFSSLILSWLTCWDVFHPVCSKSTIASNTPTTADFVVTHKNGLGELRPLAPKPSSHQCRKVSLDNDSERPTKVLHLDSTCSGPLSRTLPSFRFRLITCPHRCSRDGREHINNTLWTKHIPWYKLRLRNSSANDWRHPLTFHRWDQVIT